MILTVYTILREYLLLLRLHNNEDEPLETILVGQRVTRVALRPSRGQLTVTLISLLRTLRAFRPN